MRKELPKIIIIFLITVGVVLWGLNFIFLGKAPKSKAAGETISFVFDPSAVSQTSGDFTTSVKIKPSVDMTIRGYQFEIPFDKSKIQFKSIQYKTGAVSAGVGDDDSKKADINQNGKIKVVGEIQSATGQVIQATQNTEIVAVTFTANSAQSSSITTGATDAKFFMIKADYSLFEVPSASQASFSVNGGGPTLTPTVTPGGPTLTPVVVNKISWKTEHVSLEADDFYIIANGKKFLGNNASLIIKSDPPDPPSENYTTLEAIWKENNKEMRLFIYFYKDDKNWWSDEMRTYNAKVSPDWIYYKGKYFKSPVGQTWTGKAVLFESVDGLGKIYFLNPRLKAFLKTPVNTPTPTPTGGVDATLKLKLKFQGISKKPTGDLNRFRVKLKLYDENTERYIDSDSDNFTADDNGIWSRDVTFNGVFPTHRYVLLVKGPYHIQKKVCVEKPTETAGGTYRCIKGSISLTSGNNNLDLSGIILLSGDLPDQDGTINAYDTSLIRNNLGKDNDNCDVNRDGTCDTQDYSLVIAALSVKNDEL